MLHRSFPLLSAAACCAHLIACSGDVGTAGMTVPPPGANAADDGSSVGAVPPPPDAYMTDDAAPQEGEPRDTIVWIWLQEHQDLDERILLDACDIWAPTGLVCGLTGDPDGAEIRIFANEADCVDEDGDGSFILATAYWTWDIVVEGGCIYRTWGNEPDERWMRVLLAHEIGHVIGMPHVPYDCQSPDVMVHTSGQRICGNAVMNPMLNPAADYMTAGDWLNWEMRLPNVGPLPGQAAACTLAVTELPAQ